MLEGGCECGALRYEVSAEPFDAGYCHCRICQRTSGGPTQAYAQVKTDQIRYTKGEPKIYLSTEWAQREFCAHCGSQILSRGRTAPHDVSFSISTLDKPDAVPPKRHIFTKSRIHWFEIADDLPRE